jgi:proton-translocating NADH-quinone oxidoreductase chain M
MLTPLLDLLALFVLTVPLVGFVGRKLEHEKKIVFIYIILAFTLSFALTISFYNAILWNDISLSYDLTYFEVDALSVFISLIFLGIGVLVSIFSVNEIESNKITVYYTVLLAMIFGMIGILFSADLFTLFIFWEIMCLCSYTLVAFHKEKWEAIEASFKYLIMSSVGSITILFSLSFLYGLAGTLNIKMLSISFLEVETNVMVYISLVMLIVGFGLQAGMVPFHTWLPDAHMAAPNAISAILSGIVVKAGIFGLLKILLIIFNKLMWQNTIIVFSLLTMFIGNISALFQDDVKRLLAYSTIANIGYILLGIAIGSQRALTGSIFHILNHAIIKALLFLTTGAFIYRTKTRSLKDLAGIRKFMPITGTFFIIGVLSLSSFPFLNIFWSEFILILSGWESGSVWLSFLMIINLVFSAVYCLRLIQTVGIEKKTLILKKSKEAPIMFLIPIIILGLLSILIGIYPSPFQNLAEIIAKSLID